MARINRINFVAQITMFIRSNNTLQECNVLASNIWRRLGDGLCWSRLIQRHTDANECDSFQKYLILQLSFQLSLSPFHFPLFAKITFPFHALLSKNPFPSPLSGSEHASFPYPFSVCTNPSTFLKTF